MEVQGIPYRIEYRPGKENTVADALSRTGRGPDEQEDRPILVALLNGHREAIRERHDTEEAGHAGAQEVLRRLRRDRLNWDKMGPEVRRYVQECQECQQVNRRPGGGHIQIPRPTEPWTGVSIDHITKLPPRKGKDSILVIKDQTTGALRLKATTESRRAEGVWEDCWNAAWRIHGIPKEIRTDRGTTFVSDWWRRKMKEKGIKHSKTTSYHPNSNGLVERANQDLKNYLRKFMRNRGEWIQWLDRAEWALNNRAHRLQQISPNELLTRLDKETLQNYNARFRVTEVTQKERKYELGEKVWLKTNKETLCGVGKSLEKIYRGPFEITKIGPNQTYKLNIPDSGIHDTFHSCRLKPYYPNLGNEDSGMETTETRSKEGTGQEQGTKEDHQAIQATGGPVDSNRRPRTVGRGSYNSIGRPSLRKNPRPSAKAILSRSQQVFRGSHGPIRKGKEVRE